MKGLCFAVVDNIAEKVVVYFGASNEADARRFVRTNFSKAPRESLDGLNVVLVLDWTNTEQMPSTVATVLEWVPDLGSWPEGSKV